MILHPVIIVNLGQIAGAMIRQNDDHDIVFLETVSGPLQRSPNRRPARPANKHPLLPGQPPSHDGGIFVSHFDEMVNQRKIDISRQNVLPDPFGKIGINLFFIEHARFLVFFEYRTVSIDAHRHHIRIVFLQVLGNAAHRPARANAGDIMSNLSICIPPYLRAGGLIVRYRIRQVVVLVRIIGIFGFPSDPLGHRIIGARVLGRDRSRAHNDFGTDSTQNINLFPGLLVSQGKNTTITLGNRSKRQPHAGISGSPLNNRSPWLQVAPGLGILNHFDSHPVLH